MRDNNNSKIGFGTTPVFLTTISTILGAILFLRFGYAVAHTGFWGLIAIIVIGHAVTIPTAMAIAEIATNQKVEGGGAYYIISRSFGLNIGGAIGITLYLSQAISVSFYVIALAEAFTPIFDWIRESYGINITDTRVISLPIMLLLSVLIIKRGANMGMKALYFVVAILFVAIIMFFLGKPIDPNFKPDFTSHISNPDNFFYVFTIIFPAFTGIIAGLGLSGDLKDPKKSIPLGTLGATVVGIIVYILAAYKLSISASPEILNSDQLIMSQIAIWGPIIPIGLAAATISSALGSVMVAPRTLQALGADKIFQFPRINDRLAKGRSTDNEPINASILTMVIATFFVLIGNINFIAEIIAMFFMITYGIICAISFLEHFAADPAYRPSFKSKWQLSLLGALFSFWLMFKMNFSYAALSVLIMAIIYIVISRASKDKKGLANIFQGVIFQASRNLRVFLQKSDRNEDSSNWRPSIVCISGDSFERLEAFELLRIIANKYGFGTYIHFIHGYLSKSTHTESKEIIERLIKLAEISKSNVYLDTLVSPSYTSAIAQVIQLPSVSGKENNLILFEFNRDKPENLDYIIDNFQLLKSVNFDVGILGSSIRSFGYKKEIHVWLTSKDFLNANLMILLAYIVLGHKDWNRGQIKLFAAFPEKQLIEQYDNIKESIKAGRLPISRKNISLIPLKENETLNQTIVRKSKDADLTFIGFREEQVKHEGKQIFEGYHGLGNILFVNTTRKRKID